MKLAQQMVAASADPTTTNEAASSPDFQSDSSTDESSDEPEPEPDQNVETTPVAQKQTKKCAWKEKCVGQAATKWVFCFGDACTEKVHNLCCSKNAGPQEPGKTYCPKCVPERKVTKRVAKRKVTVLVGGEKTQQLRRSSRRRKVVSSCLLLVCLLVCLILLFVYLQLFTTRRRPRRKATKPRRKPYMAPLPPPMPKEPPVMKYDVDGNCVGFGYGRGRRNKLQPWAYWELNVYVAKSPVHARIWVVC